MRPISRDAAFLCSLPVIPASTVISNLESSRPIFRSWQNTYATPHAIPVHAHPVQLSSHFNARRGAQRDPQVRRLGSHVAVRDSPYLIVHSPCLAGGDGQDRGRHRREQKNFNILVACCKSGLRAHFRWLPTCGAVARWRCRGVLDYFYN